MKIKKYIGLLFLALLLVLGGCGKEKAEQADNNIEADEKKSNDPVEIEKEMTISEAPVTPFENIDGKTAVKLFPKDWADPYDAEQLRFYMYYGDQELITAAKDDGIYRYDLREDKVVWELPYRSVDSGMHNGVFYVTQTEESNAYAMVSAISIEDGKILHNYDFNDHEMANHLTLSDNYMLFISKLIDRTNEPDEHNEDLLVVDLQTEELLWTTPTAAVSNHRPIVELDDGFLLVNYFESGGIAIATDQTSHVYDKNTGNEIYQITADTLNDKPVANEHGIYFLDFRENVIKLYDFNGTLLKEVNPQISFEYYQLIQPAATSESLIYADNEGIVWYETDLSAVQHRVELGECAVRYMTATDDRIYAIVSENTEDESEIFYVVSLDIHTGEIYEKIELETNANTIHAHHVFNNKYHFALFNPENDDEEIYYVLSGSDVNKPF
ncbi:hypothetical protein [Bacillus sp. FJAT-50079]|uniref:hypothetical protein n=1 Tax=Bacillus sp. FJAT-50079 TaxID=2833577 RepID=UPI001BC8DE5B|nr:hypothetical protein [Bacillus sp. FJAT-50079]MBS4206559.1 hypothetical protein [Bacillus sp. FJAT-50079]